MQGNMPQYKLTGPDQSEEWIPWVGKARSGNRMAFHHLTSFFQEKIFKMVYFRTRSRMDAEDLTQDIFMKALSKLATLKEDNRFKSWLFSIAVNKVRDFHRKKKIQNLFGATLDLEREWPQDAETDPMPDVVEDLAKKEFWTRIKSLLDRLSKMEKEVFILRFMDQLSIRETSQAMKKSESTVKTHLYRALKKFREDPGLIQFLQEHAL